MYYTEILSCYWQNVQNWRSMVFVDFGQDSAVKLHDV